MNENESKNKWFAKTITKNDWIAWIFGVWSNPVGRLFFIFSFAMSKVGVGVAKI